MNEMPFTIQKSAEQIAELIRTQANIAGLSEGAQITVARESSI